MTGNPDELRRKQRHLWVTNPPSQTLNHFAFHFEKTAKTFSFFSFWHFGLFWIVLQRFFMVIFWHMYLYWRVFMVKIWTKERGMTCRNDPLLKSSWGHCSDGMCLNRHDWRIFLTKMSALQSHGDWSTSELQLLDFLVFIYFFLIILFLQIGIFFLFPTLSQVIFKCICLQ